MVMVNSITKLAHFVSTFTTISATGDAQLFLNHVWKHHGLPRKVVSDRGPQFIAEFTWELYLLGDTPHCPMSPPIFLRHLGIFLLIVASPRRSALAAPIPESDDHVT